MSFYVYVMGIGITTVLYILTFKVFRSEKRIEKLKEKIEKLEIEGGE